MYSIMNLILIRLEPFLLIINIDRLIIITKVFELQLLLPYHSNPLSYYVQLFV